METPKDDIGYTGHKFDTDLGLSYMQARYYDPVIGRFYSNDPVGFNNVHNFNRYAYANNNPYKYTDPDGRDASLAAKDPMFTDPSDVQPAPRVISVNQLALNNAIGLALGGRGALLKSPTIASLTTRATEIHQAVPIATQTRTTVAVAETSQGIRVVSSSEPRLRPAQRQMLQKGEIEGKGQGHAEVTAVSAAKAGGLNPIAVAASRPICSNCQSFLKSEQIKPASELKNK
ncbi:MAG: RHS repeat-associated core domain-containing protein [Paraglaciecola sp.]|uniref:RHS repeat-associated core domain-containing protein n=1 Tax=Paraglaciecola sp. TaxID=1920173 RepID=UPI003297B182